jgi:TRAP-type C4-dicarboxylate transport system substrate-binding protein
MDVRIKRKLFLSVLVTFALQLTDVQIVSADSELHVLRYASPYREGSPYSRADRAWMERIESESNGRIKFIPFFSGSLVNGRHTVQELAAGIADVGVISPNLSRAGMHLIQGQLAFYEGLKDWRLGEEIFWSMWEKYPQMKQELEGIHVITINSGSPMYILTTDRPVKTISDLQGLRLKVTAEKVRPLQQLGIDAVPMPMGEAYVALHRGVLDGAISPADTIVAINFHEMINYISLFKSPRPPYPSRAINQKVWDELPQDLQEIVMATASWWSELIYKENEQFEARGMQKAKAIGIKLIEPSPEDVEKYVGKLTEEGERIANILDEMSLPGTDMYRDIQSIIKQQQLPN